MFRHGYQIRNQSAHYFLTFQIVGWIDIFSRKEYRDIVVDSFNFCHKTKGLKIYGWVIMSNHIHCILSSPEGKLSDTIRDLKRHTSKFILESVDSTKESRRDWMLHQFKYYASRHTRNENYQLWTHENHPIEIVLSSNMFDQRLNYIHENPVRAGVVELPEEYLYSSARDYAGKKGLIEIDYMA
ncbi:MAG: transposase [Chitinophagales bacterium]